MACVEVQQSVATFLPFVAVNTTDGSPRTGIIFSEVDVSYKKSDQSVFSVKSLTAPDFRENGSGVYEILFTGTELDTLGTFLYVVNGNGGLAAPTVRQYVGQANVESAATYTPGSVSVSTNIITGNILDMNGSAVSGASISARVFSTPTLSTAPNVAGISTGMVSAATDSVGFFALSLIQGSVVDISIPVINYRRTLTVPANSTDVLWDIP